MDWSKVEREIQLFNQFYNNLQNWKSQPPTNDLVEATARGDAWVDLLNFGTEFYKWLTINSTRPQIRVLVNNSLEIQEQAQKLLGQRQNIDNPKVPFTSEFFQKAHIERIIQLYKFSRKEIQKILDNLAPEKFTYQGFKIVVPQKMSDNLARRMLEGVDYLVALFKNKGMSKLLQKGIRTIELQYQQPQSNVHGEYFSQPRKIILYHVTTLSNNPRILKNWINEVFLHEFGHFIHLDYLHPEAKAEWDRPWVTINKERSDLGIEIRQISHKIKGVNYEERLKFYQLLEKNNFDPQKVGKKLKKLDRLKYMAWLYSPPRGPSLITTPNQVRLSERGKQMFQFLQDPDQFLIEKWGITDWDIITAERARLTEIYQQNLGIDGSSHNMINPYLTEPQIAEARKHDPSIDQGVQELENQIKALADRLGSPTGYAKTNQGEDFAETFVAFMDNQGMLSEQAKTRMLRALSLSGLYGKQVVRLASQILAHTYKIDVGDLVMYGKYKNKKGRIVGFGTDDKGQPTIEIEPVPKGQKQNKVLTLFKVRYIKEATTMDTTRIIQRVATRHLQAGPPISGGYYDVSLVKSRMHQIDRDEWEVWDGKELWSFRTPSIEVLLQSPQIKRLIQATRGWGWVWETEDVLETTNYDQEQTPLEPPRHWRNPGIAEKLGASYTLTIASHGIAHDWTENKVEQQMLLRAFHAKR